MATVCFTSLSMDWQAGEEKKNVKSPSFTSYGGSIFKKAWAKTQFWNSAFCDNTKHTEVSAGGRKTLTEIPTNQHKRGKFPEILRGEGASFTQVGRTARKPYSTRGRLISLSAIGTL